MCCPLTATCPHLFALFFFPRSVDDFDVCLPFKGLKVEKDGRVPSTVLTFLSSGFVLFWSTVCALQSNRVPPHILPSSSTSYTTNTIHEVHLKNCCPVTPDDSQHLLCTRRRTHCSVCVCANHHHQHTHTAFALNKVSRFFSRPVLHLLCVFSSRLSSQC